LSGWAEREGMSMGMNGNRRELAGLLADATATTVMVDHRDRLGRFGVEQLEAALAAQGATDRGCG
jgi:putative resolvase